MTQAEGKTRRSDVIYDAFAEEYRNYSATKSKYIAAVDRLVIERFAGKVGTVIDFGAGDGVRGAHVFEQFRGRRLYQADISDAMVAKCELLGAAEEVWNIKHVGWFQTNVRADLIMSLWNVLGHVPSTEERVKTLSTLRRLMKPGASLVFDVNNRHYEGYGYWTSLGRRFLDGLLPDYTRGDVEFTWTIDGTEYPASGHFFTAAEVRDLLERAGFHLREVLSVDYNDGSVHRMLSKGQLFFVAENRA